MLHKFLVFYKQNKNKIIVTIGITAIILAVIHIVNNNIRNSIKEQDERELENGNQEIEKTYNESNINNTAFNSSSSLINGKEISQDSINNTNSIVNNFLKNCFENNAEESYKLISNQCKNVIFHTIDDFKQQYLNDILKIQNPKFEIENWIGNTYRLKIYTDPLISGNIEKIPFTDYITIVEDEENEYKINVRDLIKQEKINVNRKEYNDKIEFNIINRNVFMDYEEFEIKVSNNSTEDIIIDEKRYADSMYIEDDKQIKYGAYTQQISNPILRVSHGGSRNIKIKYYSKYNTDKEIMKIGFDNITICYLSDDKEIGEKQLGTVEINI